jgi:predicted nucleotidyltransferase
MVAGKCSLSDWSFMTAQTKFDVLRIINEHQETLRSFGVRRCGLFGSFLRDEISPTSDVDLLVEFEPDQKTFLNFFNLNFFLEKVLGRKVELVTPESLSPYVGPFILSEVEYVFAVG